MIRAWNALLPICLFLVILQCSGISSALSPCARWKSTGQTVAGTGEAGNSSSQIDSAKGIFLHQPSNALYVADFYNGRVQMFLLNQSAPTGITVAWNLDSPMKVFVDDDPAGPTVYVSLRFVNRTEKWVYQATVGVQVGRECRLCSGVAVDKEKNVYMSESDRHRVVRWSPENDQTVVVAGQTDTSGVAIGLLDHPQGIDINRDGSRVYVADMWNSRVQLWDRNAQHAETVAGSSTGEEGDEPQRLNFPNDVTVDYETEVVYVTDTSNHRVQRWKPLALAGETIAGGMGQGNDTDQLSKPADLAFDLQGNLYVMDMENHRVQMFALIDNEPCSPQSTGTKILRHLLSTPFFHSFSLLASSSILG